MDTEVPKLPTKTERIEEPNEVTKEEDIKRFDDENKEAWDHFREYKQGILGKLVPK
jgi:hypothetical protein